MLFSTETRVAAASIQWPVVTNPLSPPSPSSATIKAKPRFRECYTCFGCETKTVVVGIWLFRRWVYVQPYNSKGHGKSFPLMWLNIGLCWKITKICTTPVFVSCPKQVGRTPKQGGLFLELSRPNSKHTLIQPAPTSLSALITLSFIANTNPYFRGPIISVLGMIVK